MRTLTSFSLWLLALGAGAQAPSDYPLHLTQPQHQQQDGTGLRNIKFAATRGGKSQLNISPDQVANIYQDFSRRYELQISAVPGDQILTTFHYTGTKPLHAYLYIDLNQDGKFHTQLQADGQPAPESELLAYSYFQGRNSLGQSVAEPQQLSLPTFTLPDDAPTGVYRTRLVLTQNSIDPSCSPQAEQPSLQDLGGYVVDALLNLHEQRAALEIVTSHGNVYSSSGGLPDSIPTFAPLALRVLPVAPGYNRDEFSIRHGHNLDGPQYLHGNRQWEELTPRLAPNGTLYTLPAQATDAQVRITARFSPGPHARYLPVLVEEFDGEDGSQPSRQLWRRSTRYPSVTWARYISPLPEVAFLREGKLVCRAMPTPEHACNCGESQPMVSGAVETRGHFDFQYGKVEGRIRTHKHRGNFPAFWMMPTPVAGQKGWPHEGEIDIWEQIDNQDVSYHTLHTNWTYNLKNKDKPQSSFQKNDLDMDAYHTYGIEWTPTYIKWMVDGREVGTYRKSPNQSVLQQGQWPFDRPFYLILNQSVGNGSWAQTADLKHSYETLFDWVRVYQTKEQNPLAGLSSSPMISEPQSAEYYDLSGRRVSQPTSGIYLQGGRKVIVP